MAHVLLAVDESDASARAAAFVERFFVPREDTVTAINVAETPMDTIPPIPFGGLYRWPWPAVRGTDRTVTEEALAREEAAAEARAARQAPRGSHVEVLHGDPVEAILLAAADEDADLVVVGSNHRGFLERIISGSVSEDLVRKAQRPVLVVP
jgi:nucleotide-binding universal stress UspA family protein